MYLLIISMLTLVALNIVKLTEKSLYAKAENAN